tara:strand:+ start:904 stop:1623 length:720 start_codon:yes stop_codon:yes gene_type:complete
MLFQWLFRLLHTFLLLALLYTFSSVFIPVLVEASPITNAFINEIHYDNSGADSDEYVEIVGDANIDLTGWSLLLYNGNNGSMYNSFSINSWSSIDINTQFGVRAIKTRGLQNGSPDGIALFDGLSIIQFLSYEGTFTATDGVAKDILSVDIGVIELTNTPVGFSLQLTGAGNRYSDFTWSSPQKNTFDGINTGQQFIKSTVSITSVNEPNSLLLFSLFLISIFILSKKNSSSACSDRHR